jgi:hypothetical protein
LDFQIDSASASETYQKVLKGASIFHPQESLFKFVLEAKIIVFMDSLLIFALAPQEKLFYQTFFSRDTVFKKVEVGAHMTSVFFLNKYFKLLEVENF